METCGIVALLLLFATSQLQAAQHLPPYIQPCSVEDHNFNGCALESARAAVPHFVEGDRKYRVPSFNPLKLDRIQVDDGHGPLGLAFVATNATIHGMKDLRIDVVNINLGGKRIFYDVYVPRLEIDCVYNVSGKILLLPIVGEGPGNITLSDLHMTYTYDFDLKKGEDGLDYMDPKNGHLDYNITRLYMHLENLFNGNKLLGDNTNKFINENWQEVQTSVGPIVAEAISEVIRQILANIFSVVPMKNAFLDY